MDKAGKDYSSGQTLVKIVAKKAAKNCKEILVSLSPLQQPVAVPETNDRGTDTRSR